VTDELRVLAILPRVEALRRSGDAARAIAWARARGRRAKPRDEAGLAKLEAAIGRIDRRLRGGNCWRRVLLRVALDPIAAAAPVHLGFDVAGDEAPGHAWIGSDRGRPEPYGVEIEV
jgi:hypothetical protein